MKMRTRFSMVLLCCLLAACESGSSLVEGVVGQSVTLTCTYDIAKHGVLSACWSLGAMPRFGCGSQIAATDGDHVTEESGRYKMLGRLEGGDVSLTILDAKKQDAGEYSCRVEVPGLFNDEKHSIELIIMDAPQTTTLKTDVSTKSIATTSKAVQMTSSEGLQNSSSLNGIKTKLEKHSITGSMVAIGVIFGLILVGAVIIAIIVISSFRASLR
ncbi:hepatitis A virus cellular receptor 1 homolog isoform X2 [Vanacampus margaritifer]